MCGGGGSNEIPETSQEKAAAEIAMKEWKHYQDVYVPLENAWMEDIKVTGEDRAKVAGEAGALATKKFDDAPASLAPGSGKFTMNSTDLNAQRGTVAGRSMAGAAQSADDSHYAGLQAAVNVGRGQATEAQLGLGNIAAQSVNDATSSAINDWQEKDDTLSAGGAAAGLLASEKWRTS